MEKINHYELNTSLLNVFECDTYQSILDPDLMESDYNSEYGTNGVYCHYMDMDLYKAAVVDLCRTVFNEQLLKQLKECGVSKFCNFEYSSPKEYNYSGDFINLTVVMEDDWKKRASRYMKEAFSHDNVRQFVSEVYCGCPGYINLMPETYEELMDGIRKDDFRSVAAYITLILVKAKVIYRKEGFWTSCYDDEYIYYYVTECDLFKSYDIFELAGDLDFGRLYKCGAEWEEFYHNLVESIGCPWMNEKIALHELGDKFGLFQDYVDYTPAIRLVHWAIYNRYSLADLKVAIKTGKLERLTEKSY